MHALFWVAVFTSVGCVAVALTDLEEWKEFKKTYEKNYPDPVEDAYHFAVFKNALKEVKEHNDRYNRHEEFTAIRIIGLSDIPEDQWPVLPPLPIPENLVEDDISIDIGNEVVPESIDWREKGYVTPVKDQGNCNACWIYAGVANLESLYKRKSGKLEVLSEQNIKECYPEYLCSFGGQIMAVFDFVAKQQGLIDPEKYYPTYNNRSADCKFDRLNAVNTTVVGHRFFTGEDRLKDMVGTFGPVAVSILVNEMFRKSNGSVVYDPTYKKGKKGTHSILVVGYGTQKDGGDYWLLKNSWGTTVGDKGYFKLARNRDGNLGIGDFCVYPADFRF